MNGNTQKTQFKAQLRVIFDAEQPNLILWSVVFAGLANYLSVIYFSNITFYKIFAALILAIFAYFLAKIHQNSSKKIIFWAFFIFLLFFIITFFSQKIINNYHKITGIIFVDVRGKIDDINKFKKGGGANLLLSDLILYKSEYKQKSFPKAKKMRKISENYILRNFMNLGGYQEIDRDFLEKSKNYQQILWIKKGDREIYPKPPKRLMIALRGDYGDLAPGDEIYFRAIIGPSKQKEFIGDYDFALDALSKRIGGYGNVLGKIVILKKSTISTYDDFITNLRKKIEQKILYILPNQQGQVTAALLMGNQNLIDEKIMLDIRNSGLAHLISISGLHLSLAAGIFFVSSRFLLSFNQYLTLYYDIKKIAAFFAIISSYIYLEISGSPVPAVRSFFAVLLVMLAILFDHKIDALRSICFTALMLILFNPYNIFSISFQLSFCAILILVVFNKIWSQSRFKPQGKTCAKKLCSYFIEMMLISIIIQFATMPFLIYYFGDVALYGALSNLIAIPLSSYTTMPLGFAAFFLMPFGLEKIVLLPMSYTIDWIIKIAQFVSNLSYSHIYMPQMPSYSLAVAIFGGLIFCFCQNKLKLVGVIIFVLSFIPIYFIKSPDLLIDGNARFFAIYDKANGLVFSQKLRQSKKRDLWMKKMNEKEFKSFENFSDMSLKASGIECSKEICHLNYHDKKILVIKKRVPIKQICDKNYDIVINLTRRYFLPRCAISKIFIDNNDLFEKGMHFLYFREDKIVVKSVRK